MNDTPTATVLPFPGERPGRTQKLLREQVDILQAMGQFEIGTPVSRLFICDKTRVSPLLVDANMALFQVWGLVTACADPVNHFRIKPRGVVAYMNGHVMFDPKTTILGGSGKPVGARS